MSRKATPEAIETAVLLKSRRRCCVCFGLHRDLEIKRGQIAHLDQNAANADEDNLAFMCLEHHDWYDSQTSQSKGPTLGEVKEYRSELYEALLREDAEQAAAVRESEYDEEADKSEEAKYSELPIMGWERPRANYPAFLDVAPFRDMNSRVFLHESVEDIRKAVQQMPPLSRREAAEVAYAGRWIRFRGIVRDVDEGDQCYRVWLSSFEEPSYGPGVSLTFPLAWRRDVEPLRRLDRISVEGQIRRADSGIELVYPLIVSHWRQSKS